jgi:hypothetical protein
MGNKQPFYHNATILFTATEPLDRDEVTKLLKQIDTDARIIADSVECSDVDDHPGDPVDLME